MESIIQISDFHIETDAKRVLELLDCNENNQIYAQVLEEYYSIEKYVGGLLEPKGLLLFDSIPLEISSADCPPGARAAYVITTVGARAEEYSTKMFREEAYLKGLLADAIADVGLFSMDVDIETVLKEECASRYLGIAKRLEAPGDIPIHAQKVAFDKLHADSLMEIAISTGYMFNPAKTICQVFLLSQDPKVFEVRHDCRDCKALHCKLRHRFS